MPTHSIHIDRLELDLRGIAAPVAREALASFGPALQQALAAQPAAATVTGRLEHLDVGALQLPAGASAAGVRDALVLRLVHTLTRPASS